MNNRDYLCRKLKKRLKKPLFLIVLLVISSLLPERRLQRQPSHRPWDCCPINFGVFKRLNMYQKSSIFPQKMALRRYYGA